MISRKYIYIQENRGSIQQSDSNFEIPAIDDLSATKIISKLSNTESTGFDGISTKMLKTAYNLLLPHIIALINLIFSTAIFPQLWKQSKIISIYKGSGNQKDFNILDLSHSYLLLAKPLNNISSTLSTSIWLKINCYLIISSVSNPNIRQQTLCLQSKKPLSTPEIVMNTYVLSFSTWGKHLT